MNATLRGLAASVALVLAGGSGAAAQPVEPPAASAAPPGLTVAGDLPRRGAVSLAEIQAMAPVTAKWTHHGATRTVVGVPLEKVLALFGYSPGPMEKGMAPRDKRPGYKLTLLASAPDGFQAVFSAAEITGGMGTTQALVVWQVDGKPLPAEQGPLRLVVTSDGEPSRSLFQLRRLDVVDLRRAAGARGPVVGPLGVGGGGAIGIGGGRGAGSLRPALDRPQPAPRTADPLRGDAPAR